jgi:glyoxylase-like metal-dependent hydrolase (beta-lactamase superfamily II)
MCPVRELKKIVEDVYYIPGRTNVGVIVRDDWCILVDTGLDEDQGRRIVNIIRDSGLKIKYIFNTHSHADHVGGNSIILDRSGAIVIAPSIESYFIENPVLEPIFLYGSYPPESLREKFFMAKPSKVDRVISEGVDGELDLTYVALPGHSFNMYGLVAGDVFFIGDALFPENLIKKFGVLYHFNVRDTVKTLYKLREAKHRYYVPCHFEPASDVGKVVEVNLDSIKKVRKLIEEHTISKISMEELFSIILSRFKLELSPQMYFLYSSALKSYISWLVDERDIDGRFEDGRLYLFRVE